MDLGTGIGVAGAAIAAMGTILGALWKLFPSDRGAIRIQLEEERRTNIWAAINAIKHTLEKQDERIRLLEDILIKVTAHCKACSEAGIAMNGGDR